MKITLRILTATLGLFMIFNGIFMLIFASFTTGIFLTLFAGICFFVPAVFYGTFIKAMKKRIFRILASGFGFCILIALISSLFLYIYGASDNVTYKEDYLVVLGCGLNGSSPTAPLKARLDTALDYLEKNEECMVIVSGGQGIGESISEAEAMKIYLVNRGVSEERIIAEDESTSTTENFRFSNKVSDGGLTTKNAAFITNNFHIYRANSLARIQGFSLTHMSAPTIWYNVFPCYLREILAIIKMIVFRS